MRRGLALAALVAGCGWGTVDDEAFERATGVTLSGIPYVGEDNYAPGVLDRRLAELREVAGADPRVGEIYIFASGLSLVVQDPKNPANFDTYAFYDTRLQDPKVATGAHVAVPLSAIVPALATIPAVVRDAVTGTEFTVNHVRTVTVNVSPSGPPTLTVSIDNKRRDLSVVYDHRGQRLTPR